MDDQLFHEDVDDGSRRRGLWGLSVLAMAAVIVLTFVVLFTGSKEGGPDDLPVGAPTSSSEPITNLSPTSTTPGPSSSTGSSAPSRPVASDDVLALTNQINVLRSRSSVPAVTATGSRAARECAARGGAGSACVPHYIYASVPSTDATATMQALRAVSTPWFLDRSTQRLEIGWARLPSGAYNCAVLKFP